MRRCRSNGSRQNFSTLQFIGDRKLTSSTYVLRFSILLWGEEPDNGAVVLPFWLKRRPVLLVLRRGSLVGASDMPL